MSMCMFVTLCKHGADPNSQQCHLCELDKRISDLTKKLDNSFDFINGNLTGIAERIKELEKVWHFGNPEKENKPYKCPCCHGIGDIYVGDHISGVGRKCTACEGKGIIWG